MNWNTSSSEVAPNWSQPLKKYLKIIWNTPLLKGKVTCWLGNLVEFKPENGYEWDF